MSNPLYNAKTTWPKQGSITRKWYVIDAKDQVLGRLSTKISSLLIGKGKPIFTPSVDCGDCVVAVNASKVKLTGKKIDQKHLFHHTGYPGGKRVQTYKKLKAERPERILMMAVKRMLPKNKLASRQITRFKIYRGDTHPHGVQQPEKLEL